jgi:hypothetical protein
MVSSNITSRGSMLFSCQFPLHRCFFSSSSPNSSNWCTHNAGAQEGQVSDPISTSVIVAYILCFKNRMLVVSCLWLVAAKLRPSPLSSLLVYVSFVPVLQGVQARGTSVLDERRPASIRVRDSEGHPLNFGASR